MEKKFEGILVLNWKTGAMKVGKRINLKKLAPSEIPIKIDIDLVTPEYEEHTNTIAEVRKIHSSD